MISRQSGYSILEMVAVLVVISLIVFAGIISSKSLLRSASVSKSSQQIKILMQATNEFYEAHCGIGDFAQPTISQLISDGFLNDRFESQLALGGTVTSSISWGNLTQASRIRVSVTLPSTITASGYKDALNADRVSGQTLTWDESPNIFTRLHGSEIKENIELMMTERCR